MGARSKLEHLAPTIKAALIEKILTTPGDYAGIALWLEEAYGEKHSRTSIGDFAKKVRAVYSGLIDLGLTPAELAAKQDKLERLSAYLLQKQIIDRRIKALEKELFDDETEAAP